MKRDRYIVGPAGAGSDKPWSLTRNSEPLGEHDTQQGAVDCAVLLCRNRLKLLHRDAELQIKGKDGRIQDCRTYGHDPVESVG